MSLQYCFNGWFDFKLHKQFLYKTSFWRRNYLVLKDYGFNFKVEEKPGYKLTYNSTKFRGDGGKYHKKHDKLYIAKKGREFRRQKKA